MGNSAGGRGPIDGIHNIQHVVVIMQENRSFDHYFGTYPGADGIPAGVCVPDPLNGGCVAPFHESADKNYGGPHGAGNSTADVDGGRMDGFVAQAEHGARCSTASPSCSPCTESSTSACIDVMGYHDAREIPNYWTWAQNFVLQDHMFEPKWPPRLPARRAPERQPARQPDQRLRLQQGAASSSHPSHSSRPGPGIQPAGLCAPGSGSAPAPPSGGSPSAPPPPPPVAAVSSAASRSILQLRAALGHREHLHRHHHRVSLVVGCNEACAVDVAGQLTLKHNGRPLQLRSLQLTLAPNHPQHVLVGLSRRTLRLLLGALRTHRHVSATVTVAARGPGGDGPVLPGLDPARTLTRPSAGSALRRRIGPGRVRTERRP